MPLVGIPILARVSSSQTVQSTAHLKFDYFLHTRVLDVEFFADCFGPLFAEISEPVQGFVHLIVASAEVLLQYTKQQPGCQGRGNDIPHGS